MQAPESITTTTHHHHPGTHADSGSDTARHHTHTHTHGAGANELHINPWIHCRRADKHPSVPIRRRSSVLPHLSISIHATWAGGLTAFLASGVRALFLFCAASNRVPSSRARPSCIAFCWRCYRRYIQYPDGRAAWAAQVGSGRSISAPQHCSSAAASLAHSTHATILRTQPGTRRRRQISFCE